MRLIRMLVGSAPLALLVLGCQLNEQEKANKNVNDANSLYKEAESLAQEAFDLQNAAGVAVVPEEVKDKAGKCTAKFDAAVEKYDQAAKLTRDASGMNVSKLFTEYLEIRASQFAKQSEASAIRNKLCKLMAESGTKEKANADREAIEKESNAASEEAQALSDKAEKIEKDNADQFEAKK